MKLRAVRLLLLPVALFFSMGASAQNSLPKDSPFAPQGGAATAVAATAENIEFAGVSTTVGKKTELVFFDKTAKKSRWVTMGETAEGISVLNYDPRLEQAVVKIDGVQKVLTLRKASTTKSPVASVAPQAGFNVAPAAIPAPMPQPAAAPAPAQPATPETQAKQEQEARMLVSDLLEIGMAQRKAYEEAQRKAAEGTPPPANSAPPATAPSGQPVAPAASPSGQPLAPGAAPGGGG